MPPLPRPTSAGPRGLGALRRLGTVSDLLFLYECDTREITQLKAVADRLGLSVQAASHTFRGLRRRGLVEIRGGRYLPTVVGVEWLHRALGDLQTDLAERLDRLHIVRATRALAGAAVTAGAPVVLTLEDGVLVARPGDRGPSRGVARTAAARGALVEVDDLEGIVPLRRGTLRMILLPSDAIGAGGVATGLARALDAAPYGLLAAQGLESYHLVGRAAPGRPVLRFGIVAAVEEATRLGIDCTVVVLDREVPRLLNQFEGTSPPPIEFSTVRPGPRSRAGRR
ncbi:MAG TPA: hypothetical protein VMG36_06905 [Thermoplasmata archaeon]|nr:hypothetical protein [Thermoplasmata archaeon]